MTFQPRINRSGAISKEEFEALCIANYGNSLDDEKMAELFGYLDEQDTGNIVIISFKLILIISIVDVRFIFYNCGAYSRNENY